MHLWCAPAIRDETAVDHLLQHPSTAASRVLLVAGRLERRAHDTIRAVVVGQALADAGAAVNGLAEVALVVEESQAEALVEASLRRFGSAQVGIHRARAYENTRVEQVVRVEYTLDLGEQVDRLVGVHQREQL